MYRTEEISLSIVLNRFFFLTRIGYQTALSHNASFVGTLKIGSCSFSVAVGSLSNRYFYKNLRG